MENKTYQVTGMDCADCARTVEKGVSKLEGVKSARVEFATQKLVIEGKVAHEVVRERVEALGYGLADEAGAKPEITAEAKRGGIIGFWLYLLERAETRLALGGGAIILLTWIATLLGFNEMTAHGLFIAATLIAGYSIARSGLNALLINHDFNINLLMTIAVIGAIFIGEVQEGATVIFLFAIGEALEGYTTDRARDSLRSLMSLAPAQATLLNGETVAVSTLKVGDVILVRAGERIPMDGIVTDGESDVNQAPITGESIPVHKGTDSEVFAGTINGSGLLKIQVTRLAADNTLSRIIKLVEEVQSVRAPSQRMIDQFARVYTPAVVVIAALIATLPPLLFNAPFWDTPEVHGWLYRALALLVIACPCALVISAPVTVISGITAAARRGVLIKGGAHLEALGRVKAFAFDKTGTLTHGQPVVLANRSFDCETGGSCALCDDVLALASAVESRSAHPLAKAITGAAKARGLDAVYPPAESVETLTGLGVRGKVADSVVTIGSHSMFDAQFPHEVKFCEMVKAAEAQGQTTMLLRNGERVQGYIAVADTVRASSRNAVSELKKLGGVTAMLTGDNDTVARVVGMEAGVDDVRAGLLPADKVDAVKALSTKYGSVAMIGDGINDTPALAAANVGIAMGSPGSAQALETADIALMADDLSQLPYAVRLSRFTRGLIRENVVLTLGVKALFVLLALGGVTSLWLAIAADVGMSLLVTLNGMRPLRFE